ncbi:MAG: hypothetical protein E7546_02780 [Ruminococcaceae bacterium]|nr:hypothetical protein [Oscillospiraceae bacterium]
MNNVKICLRRMIEMIIDTFNGVYFALLALTAVITVVLSLALRNKSETVKKWTIIGICIFDILFFCVYKYGLSVDKEYLELTGQQTMNWFSELPLHLCNINMFLIPISLLTKKRSLLGFCFTVAPLGALLALTFPSVGFGGYDIFLFRNIGFYGTHILIIISAICIATLGFFRPTFKDIPGVMLFLLVLSAAIFGVNNILIATGLCEQANYFYTMGPDGISILEMFWSIIPVKFVYLAVFGVVILGIYLLVMALFFNLGKKQEKAEITE